jgi:hypothetical protein
VKSSTGLEEYAKFRHQESLAQPPVIEGEDEEEKRRRELASLNIKFPVWRPRCPKRITASWNMPPTLKYAHFSLRCLLN